MEFSRRDMRWLQGNMQYCQLVSLPGLKPVSRYQLCLRSRCILGSPAWMAMTAIGTFCRDSPNAGRAICAGQSRRGHDMVAIMM